MAARKPSATARQREREKVAQEFAEFRRTFLFRQIDLADALQISRRSVQMVEAGNCLPQMTTRARFRDLKQKRAQKQNGAVGLFGSLTSS